MQCKILKKEIDTLMSFGKMPLANAFIDKKNFESEFFYEMKVGFCNELSLFQLDEHPDPSIMFNDR